MADGMKNFAANVVLDRVDALQIRRIARIGGVDLDHHFLRPMSKDPNDHSQLVATLVGTAALTAAGGAAEAAGLEGVVGEGGGGGTRLVLGAGRANRMPGMELPGDFTVDRTQAPFGNVLFERVPGMSLTPQAAENAYNAVRPVHWKC